MVKIGDRVKFLNDVGGGVVTGFQSKKIAVVEGEDGFEIPVMMTELVKAPEEDIYSGSRRRNTSQEDNAVVEEKTPEPDHVPVLIPGNDKPNFFMAFHPVDQHNPVGGEIEIYFINDSNFSLLYQYAHFDGHEYETVDSGVLEPNTKNYLEGLSLTDLSDLPKFWFQIIPFIPKAKKLTQPIVKDVAVNAVKFYKEKSFTSNDYFEGNAMMFDLVTNPMQEELDKLTDKDFEKVITQKDKDNRPKEEQQSKKKTPDLLEVDLHIEELIDSKTGLSNKEILDVQMDKFTSEMDEAIKNRAKRIVFIHGVGNGVLKQEIAKKLKSKYARFRSQDASFKEYGYGATMVIFRRK